MRVFARRERPHPGAQLTLPEAEDGWRYTLRATNLPEDTKGWRGQCAYIDAGHRVHARVEDMIRTGKDTGPGHFPSRDYGLNKAWLDASMTACILLSWLRHLALDGKPRESRAENPALPRLPHGRPTRARRTPQDPQDRGHLAQGHGDHHCLEAHPGPPEPHLTSKNRPCAKEGARGGPWTPGHRPDSRAISMPRHRKTAPAGPRRAVQADASAA